MMQTSVIPKRMLLVGCRALTTVALCMAVLAASADVRPVLAEPAALNVLLPQAERAALQFLADIKALPRLQWRDKAQALVRNWLAASNMARRLAGADNWSQLSELQRSELADEIQRTVTRYLLEAADAYTDQRVQLQAPVATRSQRARMGMAVTGVPLRERIVAALDWQLSEQQWRIADFSVEGISYAGTKRWQYAVLWRQGGYAAFYQHLKTKNDEFFSAWAQNNDLTPKAPVSVTGAPR